jgi:hypothetical protein
MHRNNNYLSYLFFTPFWPGGTAMSILHWNPNTGHHPGAVLPTDDSVNPSCEGIGKKKV